MNANPLLISAHLPAGPDASVLGAHLEDCQRALGRSFGLRCIGESLHAVIGARLVTTVAGAVGLMVLLFALV